ncbi:MAG: SpoIIE family protein phosphatase [Chitinispirillaceae bacterium]|nr:SpoIIE family protein phosphatase [Chitinispirillaceae bacterium]
MQGESRRTGRNSNKPSVPAESELLIALLDNIPDSIYFKDRSSRFLRVNKGWCAKHGVRTPDEVAGKTDFDFFSNIHARQAFADEQKVVRTGEPIVGIEEKETWQDRPDTWVSTTKMPLHDKQGTIIGTFGLSRDITEVKGYRDALQAAKDELEVRVEQRTAELRDAKRRLEQNVEQLTSLNSIAYELAGILDVDTMLQALGRAFLSRFPSAHVAVCQKTNRGYSCAYATGLLDEPDARRFAEQALASLVPRISGSPQCNADWLADKRYTGGMPGALAGCPCWIVIPLRSDTTLLATVQLFGPPELQIIFKQEKAFIATLAAHGGICLNNTLNYSYLKVKARLEGEFKAASNIQRSFAPDFKCGIPRVDMAGLYRPAHEVGGDYLDCFKNSDGSTVVMIADVCGKGVPAALLMTVLRSIARAESRTHFSAQSLLAAVNATISSSINERSFITALCLVIAHDGSSMTCARAGHTKLLKIDAGREDVAVVESRGLALGLIPDEKRFAENLEEVTLPLAAGDLFFTYTDGLTEAVDAAETPYGIARLKRVMQRSKHETSEGFLEIIITDVRKFVGRAPAHDDCAMFVMKVRGQSSTGI